MRVRCGLIVVACVGFLLPSCAPSEKAQAEKAAVEAEQKLLEGKWKVASLEGSQSEDGEGDEKPDPSFVSYYVIENGILREEFKGKDGAVEVISRRRMNLMPSTSPKGVDLVYVDENGKDLKERRTKKGLTGKKKTSTSIIKDVAVYKLEGNKLELCISWDEKNRPTDFSAPTKSSRYLVKLEKVVDGKDEKPGEGTSKSKS